MSAQEYKPHLSQFASDAAEARGGAAEQDFRAAAWHVVGWIVRYKFSEREILVLLRVSLMSFHQGRPRACFPTMSSIARLTGIPENKTRAVLERLAHKKVLKVLDEGGNELHGSAIGRKGYFYGILAAPNFWDAAPRYNLTPELEALENWLMTLRPEEPDPHQPALLPREETFAEELQETAAQLLTSCSISPTRGAGASAIRPDRSSSNPDADIGATGGSNRESAGSVADDQPMPARGVASPGLPATQIADAPPGPQQTSQKGRLHVLIDKPPQKGGLPLNLPKREPPKKGGFDDTSQKGRFEHWPGPLGDCCDPPKKGGLPLHVRHVGETCSSCSDASSKKKQEEQTASSALKQPEQVCTGGSKGGNRTAEVQMMARIRQLHGDSDYANWGGYWRKWYRLKPELVQLALERLILRLDNPQQVARPGAWMRDQFERLKRL